MLPRLPPAPSTGAGGSRDIPEPGKSGARDSMSLVRTLAFLASALVSAAVASFAAFPAAAQVAVGPPLDAAPVTNESCEAGVLPQLRGTIPVPSTCTLMGAGTSGQWTTQVPRGNWRITSVNVRTGPRTGPMRIQVVRNMRSQATGPNGEVAGAICCTSPAQSQVFTLPPNQVSTVAVNIPVKNTVDLVDREPIEVVDYLGITILDRNSSLPVGAGQAMLTMFLPALNQGGQDLMGPSFQGMFPLVSAVVCPAATAASLDASARVSLQRPACATVPGGTSPAPGGGSAGGGGGATPPAAPAAVAVRSTVPRQSVAQLRGARAIRTTCRADVRAACAARATVTAATARALGLRVPRGARTVALGARRVTVPAGRVRPVAIPLSSAVRAALGRARSPVRITVTTTASAGGRSAGRTTRTLVARP